MTSQVVLGGAPSADQGVVYKESDDSWATVGVGRADGERCQRCWRYVPALSAEPQAGLCDRCEAALTEAKA